MATLAEIIRAVNEKNLTKTQIEDYHTELTNLFALQQLSLAELRKSKALFFIENAEKTVSLTEKKWAASQAGLREIDLSHHAKATEKLLSSLRNRLYSTY